MSKLATLRGRPSGLHLGGLFLFDPASIMKLEGFPLRAQFTAAGYESAFKGLERAKDLNLREIPPKLAAQMGQILSEAAPSPMTEIFRRAFAGDADARATVKRMGLWEVYRQVQPSDASPTLLKLLDFMVRIETESFPIERLLIAREFMQGANAIARHPLLRRFVSQEALEALEAADAPKQIVWFQLPGAVSVLVCQVALLEKLLKVSGSTQWELGHLLTPVKGDILPGRQFVEHLKAHLGAMSISDLLDLQIGMESPPDESTWKRWSSGAIFPPGDSLKAFLDHVLREHPESVRQESLDSIGAQFWAARRLHHVRGMLMLMNESDAKKAAFLLGRPPSMGDWLLQTFSRWRDHWSSESQ